MPFSVDRFTDEVDNENPIKLYKRDDNSNKKFDNRI